jgi:mono/diheme cytochrome c family protein
MLSLQGRDLPESYLSAHKHLEFYEHRYPQPETGEQLFSRYCAVCHDTGDYGRYDAFYKKFIPAVRGSSLVQSASAEYFDQNIRKGRPGTLMMPWNPETSGLTDEDLTKIADYLRDAPVPAADRLAPELAQVSVDPDFSATGDISRGRNLFTRHCIGCHGPGGEGLLGPAINNAVLQQSATDGFLFATIAAGRRNTAMPGFLNPARGGLSEEDVSSLVAYVRTLGNAPAVQVAEDNAQAANHALARRD